MSTTTFESWFRGRHPEIPQAGAAAVLKLAGEGATVPFMARYRKEQTGNLDEVQIAAVSDRFDYLRELVESWRDTYDWRAEEGLSAVITTAEAARNDYNLSPSRYVAQNDGERYAQEHRIEGVPSHRLVLK